MGKLKDSIFEELENWNMTREGQQSGLAEYLAEIAHEQQLQYERDFRYLTNVIAILEDEEPVF